MKMVNLSPSLWKISSTYFVYLISIGLIFLPVFLQAQPNFAFDTQQRIVTNTGNSKVKITDYVVNTGGDAAVIVDLNFDSYFDGAPLRHVNTNSPLTSVYHNHKYSITYEYDYSVFDASRYGFAMYNWAYDFLDSRTRNHMGSLVRTFTGSNPHNGNPWMVTWEVHFLSISIDENGTAVNVHRNIGNEAFKLEQNYPNPFNPSTTISYELSRKSHVLIIVYDVLGRNVRTLVDDEKPAGSYQATFDAGNLPSGVYFYRLHGDSYVETKKLVLLR